MNIENIKQFLHKSFIPNPKNCYRPHALRHFMLSFYALVLLLSQLSLGVTLCSPLVQNTDQMKKDIFVKINEQRVKNSESRFTENPLLTAAAEKKLKDMFDKNYWDHSSPTGQKAWVFINQTGYSYTMAGENLARGFVTSDKMVEEWMESPTHRRNILDKDFKETGIAVGNGTINGKSATVAVQLFGTPSAQFAQKDAIVAGEKTVAPRLSLENPVSQSRLPFFVIYLAILGLVIFDGVMLRINKCHKDRAHMLAFRMSLGLNIVVLGVLCLNFVYVL